MTASLRFHGPVSISRHEPDGAGGVVRDKGQGILGTTITALSILSFRMSRDSRRQQWILGHSRP